MARSRSTWLRRCLAFLLILAVTSTSAYAQKGKGKGNGGGGGDDGGGDPPANLPAVRYAIATIPQSDGPEYISEINNSGIAVGHIDNEGFVFDAINNSFYDLNSIPSLIGQLPAGFIFEHITAINDTGNFVGDIVNTSTDETLVCVVDTASSSDPTNWDVLVLPNMGDEERDSARDINNSGDMLVGFWRTDGTRDMYIYNPWADNPVGAAPPIIVGVANRTNGVLNNWGEVAMDDNDGNIFIFDSLTQQTTTINAHSDSLFIQGFNDQGVLSGAAKFVSLGKWSAIRYDNELEILPSASYPDSTWQGVYVHQGINNENDVSFFSEYWDRKGLCQDAFLIHTGTSGDPTESFWSLDDLILASDPLADGWNSARIKRVTAMSDRADAQSADGFPLLCVEFNVPKSKGNPGGFYQAVLIPVDIQTP